MTLKNEDTGNWIQGTGSHSVENLLWKRLWTFRKTEYSVNG